MKVHSDVFFFAFSLIYFHCRRASITQWQCWYSFLFSLFPEMQLFFYICISIPKRKKIQRKLPNNFSLVRHLLFGSYSGHTWVTYTLLNHRLETMIGRFTTIGLEEDIPQREGLVSSKEIGQMCLPSKTNTCTRNICH